VRRNFGLDALRACAILAVIAQHAAFRLFEAPPLAASILSRGWSGVDLFFVLSGFLIGGQMFEEPRPAQSGHQRLLSFWTRRWTRTIPLYAFMLALRVLVKPILFHAPFEGFNWRFLFFLQNTGTMIDFAESWSLCVEEQFYFVFPLLVLALRPKRAWLWLLPAVLSLALRYAAWSPSDPSSFAHWTDIRSRTLLQLDSISVGVFLAATRKNWQSLSPALRRGLGWAGFAGFTGTLWLFEHRSRLENTFAYTALAVSGGLLLVSLEAVRAGPGWLRWPVEKIAVWSYGAYLWNEPVFSLFRRLVPRAPWAISSLVCTAGTFAAAYVTYRWIEKPGIAMRARLLPAREGASPSAAGAPPGTRSP
jgi:peptidoglycan/LPS O-acetylase OafA/YrhL